MADSVSIRHDNWRNDAQESSSAQNVFGLRGFQLDLLTEPGLLRHGRRSCDLNSPQDEAKASWKTACGSCYGRWG